MPDRPKFVQITSAAGVGEDGLPFLDLHALDEEGGVWRWEPREEWWTPYTDLRVTDHHARRERDELREMSRRMRRGEQR